MCQASIPIIVPQITTTTNLALYSVPMASENPIPAPIAHLADAFRDSLSNLDLKSTLNNPNSDTFSSSLTETADSSSFEFREEDYVDWSNPRISDTINRLRTIATEMNSAGYLNHCIQIYTFQQSSVMVDVFQMLEVQNLSKRNARTMDWESLESVIRDWNRSAIFCFKFLFLEEKRLCHQIFHGLANATELDDCFIDTVKAHAALLFDVAESLCYVRPSSEKLFSFLDLYQTLSSISPIVDDHFSLESLECVRVRPAQLLLKLAEAVRRILSDFENDVVKEQSPVHPVPEIHLLPRYVMNYVLLICMYKEPLTVLIISKPATDEAGGGVVVEFADYAGQTLLSQHLIWIVMMLLSNLETKSKFYKETPMASFFMMINVQYIVWKIERSPGLRELIGDVYVVKLYRKLCQFKIDYLGLVFNTILDCLRTEGLNGDLFSSKAKKMTKKLNTFNEKFEKAQQDVGKLVVPYTQLLEDVRKSIKELLEDVQKSIKEMLVPAYASFLEHLKSEKQSAGQHIKYSVKELETAILNLFKGYRQFSNCSW